jgi:hypothetical protein
MDLLASATPALASIAVAMPAHVLWRGTDNFAAANHQTRAAAKSLSDESKPTADA